MRVAVQHESHFDPIACARELYSLDTAGTVLPRELFGRDPRCFEDACIEYELPRLGTMSRVNVGHGLRGRLDRRLTPTLRARADNDALLGGAKTDDRGRRDSERKHDGHDRLTAFVAHGVHSTRRAAVPSTIKEGRPTKPSGTGIG